MPKSKVAAKSDLTTAGKFTAAALGKRYGVRKVNAPS
jgi:hypothetical protein